MKMWFGSPGAATALSGDVNVFVASPLVTSSIPMLGPKRVIGANRVSSKGAHGGCPKAGAAAAMAHRAISEIDNNNRIRVSIVMLLDRVHFEESPRDRIVEGGPSHGVPRGALAKATSPRRSGAHP